MVNRGSIDQVFEKLQEDEENCKCADCEASSPVFVSIKYGTFICAMCASKHPQSSETKSILSNNWNVDELKRMIAGGNSAFKEYTDYYEITDLGIELKYRTRAIDLYKRMLTEITLGNNFNEDLPSIEDGKYIVITEKGNEWIFKIKEKAENLGNQALHGLDTISEKTGIKKTSEKIKREVDFEEIKEKTSCVFNNFKSKLRQNYENLSTGTISKIKEGTWNIFQGIEESIELGISKAKNIVSST